MGSWSRGCSACRLSVHWAGPRTPPPDPSTDGPHLSGLGISGMNYLKNWHVLQGIQVVSNTFTSSCNRLMCNLTLGTPGIYINQGLGPQRTYSFAYDLGLDHMYFVPGPQSIQGKAGRRVLPLQECLNLGNTYVPYVFFTICPRLPDQDPLPEICWI